MSNWEIKSSRLSMHAKCWSWCWADCEVKSQLLRSDPDILLPPSLPPTPQTQILTLHRTVGHLQGWPGLYCQAGTRSVRGNIMLTLFAPTR